MRSQRGCVPGHDTDTAVIKDDPEVLPMFNAAMKQKTGPKDSLCNNRTEIERRTTGTTRAYTLTRLQKDNPEIAHHHRPVDTKHFVSC